MNKLDLKKGSNTKKVSISVKKIKVPVLIFFFVASIVSCENNEEQTVEAEPQTTIVDDLSFILDDLGASQTSKLGYPWNGCHEYTVSVSVYFVEVETSFHHCCVNGVCTVGELFEKNSGEFLNGAEEFTLLTSSSWTIDKYTISLAEGDYTVGKNGNINNMKYKVIIN